MASKMGTNIAFNFTLKKVRQIPFHACILFKKAFGRHFGCDFFSIEWAPVQRVCGKAAFESTAINLKVANFD